MKNIRLRRIAFLLIPATMLLLLAFFFLFGSHAAAEAGDLNDMKSYESVLVRDGDTLSSLATAYAEEYSHFTNTEYMEAIVSLNNLSSEYIHSGDYILLPRYR